MWLANKISLNCTKTELIFFHRTGHPMRNYNFNIKINGHKIISLEYIKYLGIYLDSTLSGKQHCDLLSIKCRRANGMPRFETMSHQDNSNLFIMQYSHPT